MAVDRDIEHEISIDRTKREYPKPQKTKAQPGARNMINVPYWQPDSKAGGGGPESNRLKVIPWASEVHVDELHPQDTVT